MTSAEREARAKAWRSLTGRDHELDQGEVGDAMFAAGAEYGRGATVAEIVEWCRGHTGWHGSACGHNWGDLIEARFSPAPAGSDPLGLDNSSLDEDRRLANLPAAPPEREDARRRNKWCTRCGTHTNHTAAEHPGGDTR